MAQSQIYRNIQYASAERFEPAQMVELVNAELDKPRGPIPPQNPSRLSIVLGPQASADQSEICQVLSVFTPGTTGKRPVMVWFHGGAFLTGGGELPWYDGEAFAAEQDVVVVSVSSRLGVLGFLSLAEESAPSPATTDQMTALKWIQKYINQFGGDPANITLFGHSAGAASIDTMLRWGLETKVNGVILQSGFLGASDIQRQQSGIAEQTAEFLKILGTDPKCASVDEILKAQKQSITQSSLSTYWAPVLPEKKKTVNIPVMAGHTEHDSLPFIILEGQRIEPVESDFTLHRGNLELANISGIINGNLSVAREAWSNAKKAWMYEFAFRIKESGWGAPHGIELPYLFTDSKAWGDAPMMRGADWETVGKIGKYLREKWANFARHQDPGGWVEYNPHFNLHTTIGGMEES